MAMTDFWQRRHKAMMPLVRKVAKQARRDAGDDEDVQTFIRRWVAKMARAVYNPRLSLPRPPRLAVGETFEGFVYVDEEGLASQAITLSILEIDVPGMVVYTSAADAITACDGEPSTRILRLRITVEEAEKSDAMMATINGMTRRMDDAGNFGLGGRNDAKEGGAR